MEDKFKPYYILVDHILDKNIKKIYREESDPLEVSFFMDFKPFNMAIIMRYISNIINDMCKKLISKDKVEKEIENLKNNLNNNNTNNNIWKWKNITLVDLIKGELDYIKENFILEDEMAHDENAFVNNFQHPGYIDTYPFSLKELYHILLNRGISVAINNYYYLKNNIK